MKKQIFIIPFIACIMAISNVKAQNTPIDDFLKKYPSREGVTSVAMSQQMLQSIFPQLQQISAPPNDTKKVSANISYTYSLSSKMNVPEAYNSVTISKDIPANLSADFKKMLLTSKYEQFMEVNKENSIILGYYLKKVNHNTNEIVVLRQQENQFSAIYIKGDISIDQVDRYLLRIKQALDRMGATNQTDMFPSGYQFAFSMPSFDNIKFPNFKEYIFKSSDSIFNFKMDEDLKLRMEESMKELKDRYKDEDLQRQIKDVFENSRKLKEEMLQPMTELKKQAEDDQDKSL